jgi:hypothetical protein
MKPLEGTEERVSGETVHRVTLSHVRDFQFSATFEGVSPERQILLDERPPLGQNRGPNPAALLAAAVAIVSRRACCSV